MDTSKKVLMVHCEAHYVQSVKPQLEANNFSVFTIEKRKLTLDALLKELQFQSIHLAVVSESVLLESPSLIRDLHERGFEGLVMVLVGQLTEQKQIQYLNEQADDVISLNMSADLVCAKLINRVASHVWYMEGRHLSDTRLTFGELVIDSVVREAWLGAVPIELTGAEFDLLWLLSSHAGQVMTREEIFHQLRGIEYDGQDRSVDVRVSRIRPKVGDDPDHPRRIKTIRSKGYLFVPDQVGSDSALH